MITYNGPIGEPVSNPSKEYIKDIFLNKDAAYWKQGSGDSCIEAEGCDEWLIFFYDEPYGFFTMRHPDYLVPINRSIEIKTIEHMVGGEPMKLPTCCYVERETAYRIAMEYISEKHFSDCVEWIDLYEIEFETDF